MSKLTIVILLVVACTGFFGSVHILTSDSGQGFDAEEFFSFGWSALVALLSVAASAAITRLIVQIKRAAQILLSFFFYSWRNSHYDESGHKFTGLFPSLETYCSL